MTRDEQLAFCSICKNQKFDPRIGIICSITDRVADFAESCKYFEEDIVLKQKLEVSQKNNLFAMNTASHGKRLANYLLDVVFYWFFAAIFLFFLGIMVAIIAPSKVQILAEENELVSYSVAIVAFLLYYTFFEFLTGRTIAKYITGTMVIDVNGNKPSFGTALLRSICRLIPFEAFSFLGEDAIGWHDTLSKTRVINLK